MGISGSAPNSACFASMAFAVSPGNRLRVSISQHCRRIARSSAMYRLPGVLLLFSAHDSLEPFQTIRFDPYVNKTFHVWHTFVRGLKPGVHYAYRVDGPADSAGQRFK